MKWYKSFIAWCKSALHKRRFSMLSVEDKSEEWHVLVSPAGAFAAFLALAFLIFVIILVLVAYTPIIEFLPGYKSDAVRSRESLMNNIMKLDSMERRMNDMLTYNENIVLIINGKTPAVRTTIATDSIHRNKALVAPSAEDSLLRAQMEGNGAYGLHTTVAQRQPGHDDMEMTVPVDGIITSHFDIRDGKFGIRMASASMSPVMATADGTVLTSIWTPDKAYIIEIQHPNGLISVYRNLSQTIVTKGQSVRGSEVIGYSASERADDGSAQFGFELWKGGKAVDPEGYIVF